MRQEFYTHNRIKEAVELEEEEASPLDRQIIQWPHRVSLTTLREHRGRVDHLHQHPAQEAVVC